MSDILPTNDPTGNESTRSHTHTGKGKRKGKGRGRDGKGEGKRKEGREEGGDAVGEGQKGEVKGCGDLPMPTVPVPQTPRIWTHRRPSPGVGTSRTP